MWTQQILTRSQFEELLISMNVSDSTQLPGAIQTYSMDGSRVLTILAYCSLFIVGLLGNAWVAYVIARVLRRQRRESPKSVLIYILALCLGDFVILTFSLFLIMDLMYNAWIVESVLLCRLYLSSESLNKFFVPFVLVSLSYFCYVKICRPHPQQRRGTNLCLDLLDSISIGSTRSAIFCSSLCAVSAFVLCAPVYAYGDLYYLVFNASSSSFNLNETSPLGGSRMTVMPKCAFSPPDFVFNAFTVCSFLCGFALPASLFTYFYSAILWKSRRRQRESVTRLGLGSSNSTNGSSSERGHKVKSQFWRVAKTASGLVSFYLLCWTPYWAVNLYHAWSSPLDASHDATTTMIDSLNQTSITTSEENEETQSDLTAVFGYFIHMLPYINCTGYPILYTLLNRQIIDAYKGKLSRGRTTARESITGSVHILTENGNSSSRNRSSRYGSGNSQQLLRVNSWCANVVENGEVENTLTTRRHLSISPSGLSAL